MSSSFPLPLSENEEKEYVELMEAGDPNAKDVLIERNLRLVAHIARKYTGPNTSQEDLISIGTIGLIKAINKYTSKRAARLATYAARSIENAMGTSKGDVAEQYATQLLLNEKNLEEDWIRGYSYVQIDLHPDIYRVGFSYYADQKDAEVGKESLYGYDIQVDSNYKITIQNESTAIGEDLWSENIEG